MTQVVKHIVYIYGWKYSLVTDHFIAVFKKNRLEWKHKLETSFVSCLKYFQGRIYLGCNNGRVSIYEEKLGKNLQNHQFKGSVLDIHVKDKVYILLDSGAVKETDILSDSKSIMTISDKREKSLEINALNNAQENRNINADLKMEIRNPQKNIILKEISTKVAIISANLILSSNYQVILKLKSSMDQFITKILIESEVLKSPCFIVDQGKSEFEIPLDLHVNKSGKLELRISYKSNVNGEISRQVYHSTIDIPRFNQCLYVESSLSLPPLVETCQTHDFDVYFKTL